MNGRHSLQNRKAACVRWIIFCGLHFLVALADSCSATLCQWENLHTEKPCASESGIMHLIRSACKAIQKQCSQNAGCHIMFKAFLETQGVKIFLISKFVGNRFNIVFYNAGRLYFLRNHLIRYLQEVHSSAGLSCIRHYQQVCYRPILENIGVQNNQEWVKQEVSRNGKSSFRVLRWCHTPSCWEWFFRNQRRWSMQRAFKSRWKWSYGERDIADALQIISSCLQTSFWRPPTMRNIWCHCRRSKEVGWWYLWYSKNECMQWKRFCPFGQVNW